MARDRLMELLEVAQKQRNSDGSSPTDVVSVHVGGEVTKVDGILNQYGEVRTLLATISANLDVMNKMVYRTNLRQFNENEMDDLRNQNLKIGQELMVKFRELKSKLPQDDVYTLEARMQRTLFYGLHQTYINIWNRNEAFLQSYEAKLKKNLQMHSKILNFNSTEEEVEELIANKTTSLFVGNILEETERERRTLRDLMDRFSELKKLEKSLEDVHALFIRIHNLVMEQNDLLQIVEWHAQQASMQVDKGAEEIDKAHVLRQKTLKKKTWLIAIGISVLMLFILLCFV